jgi:hypothetical protein
MRANRGKHEIACRRLVDFAERTKYTRVREHRAGWAEQSRAGRSKSGDAVVTSGLYAGGKPCNWLQGETTDSPA